MTTTATASADGDTLAPLDLAWRVGTPLTPVGFYPAYGPIPATVEVRDQTGGWDSPGQTRQLMLSDGGWVIEHLARIEPARGPRNTGRFEYDLTDFQRVFGRLVSGAHASWEYSATNTGTHIRWTYSFTALPNPAAAVALTAIVRLAWAPYMRRVVLPRILRHLDEVALTHPAE
ncbi:SRPBCC family protein [Frondihabitans australicus]|nr:SRPBCC family protein [Frondihabitans australicus]